MATQECWERWTVSARLYQLSCLCLMKFREYLSDDDSAAGWDAGGAVGDICALTLSEKDRCLVTCAR